MRFLATVILTVAFMAWSGPAAAQTFGFGAHAGVSIPTGDYSDVADVGFSGGLDFLLPLPTVTPALSWYTSVDAAGHSASSEAIDGGFLTIPVLTGARFDLGAGMVRPFVTGQLGVAFVRPPSFPGADTSTETEFAFALGGGLQLTQNIYTGAKWFNLGNLGDSNMSMSYVDIYLGFGVR